MDSYENRFFRSNYSSFYHSKKLRLLIRLKRKLTFLELLPMTELPKSNQYSILL